MGTRRASTTTLARRVLREIEKHGILLVTDPVLPSVTRFVAGEPVRGSWWSHPRAHEIFHVLTRLEEEAPVLLVKLVAKKQTFVHESLWPELFAIARAQEAWQTQGLDSAARRLWKKVEASGSLRLDEVGGKEEARALAKAARELEGRLLVHSSEEHTETGAHAKVLSSWTHLEKALGERLARVDPEGARAAFEARTSAELPWQRRCR